MRPSSLRRLTPEERAYLLSLISKQRRYDFLTSRILLKKNLPEHQNHSFLNDPKEKSILWPKGITGSLSHKKGVFAFILGQEGESFGIDLEELIVTRKIYERVTSKKERLFFSSLQAEEQQDSFFWSLIFSCKESLFKCFAPLHRREKLTHIGLCKITRLNLKEQSFEGSFEKEKAAGSFKLIKVKKKHCGLQSLILSVCHKEEEGSSFPKLS